MKATAIGFIVVFVVFDEGLCVPPSSSLVVEGMEHLSSSSFICLPSAAENAPHLIALVDEIALLTMR